MSKPRFGHARRSGSRFVVALGLALATALGGVAVAQRPVDASAPVRGNFGGIPDPTNAPQQPAGRVLIDGVRAVIGDRVILQSTVQREMARQYADQELTDDERTRLEFDIVREIAKEEIWVQIGKVIGNQDPEEFEETIDSLVQDYLDEQVQEYGSFARMDEELRATQTSWQTLAQEQRAKILRDSARQHAIRERFKDGIALLVTPRELREYYDANPGAFEADEYADLAGIMFPPGRDVAQRAAAAVAAWREDPLATPAGLAERFGAIEMRPMPHVRQGSENSLRAEVKQFALLGVDGEVSEPIGFDGKFMVLKVLNKQSQPARAFDDINTQNLIRRFLVDRKMRMLEARILTWKFEKIMTWPPQLMGGR